MTAEREKVKNGEITDEHIVVIRNLTKVRCDNIHIVCMYTCACTYVYILQQFDLYHFIDISPTLGWICSAASKDSRERNNTGYI